MTYEDCYEAGMTQAQTAQQLGVSRQAVSKYAKRHNLDFRADKQRGKPVGNYRSMSEAARAEGITPQAIRQRLERAKSINSQDADRPAERMPPRLE